MAEITLAKTAGFCFGVNRAIRMVEELADSGKKVCTLGPIIHNAQMVAQLEARGVSAVDSPEDAPADATLVIRSHGVEKEVRDAILASGRPCANATCPFVLKIHRLAAKAAEEGRDVLVAGDPEHPEVKGILSHCGGRGRVFSSLEELQSILAEKKNDPEYAPCVVSQTTFHTDTWKKCLKFLENDCTNAKLYDTICNATFERQQEAVELAGKSDFMVIVGGRHSSNTAKLYEICRAICPSVLIETADELPIEQIRTAHSIGVTAGASTPGGIIKEVLQTMTEILNKENNLAETVASEGSFAEMLEESLKTFNTDEKVHGVVVGIAPNEVYVDVGRKQAGFIPLSELSNDSSACAEDLVKIGDEMDLLIMRTNDQEGTIMLSKRRLDAMKGWEVVAAACEDQSVLTGTVTEIIKGGVIAVTNGVRVFIPASQATATRGEALDGLLKQEVSFRILEVNRSRRRAVGSIRSVAADKRKELEAKFWETAEEGKVYNGVVKSLTSYGAFVDIGGVDGMIHISEMSWNRIKNPAEVLTVGQEEEVFILKLDAEKKKISLGYRKAEDNPWEVLKNNYPVDTVCEVTIVGMTDFGAFARVIPGIDGLIHISQISTERINKPQDVLTVGQTVTVKVTAIDFDKKRVSLSMKAAAKDAE